MRLRAPPGCGSVFHAERIINVDDTGHVNVHEDAADALFAHGFIRATDVSEPRPEAAPRAGEKPDKGSLDHLNRRELFAFLKEKGVGIQLQITNQELRELAETARRGRINGSQLKKKEG